MRLIDAHKLTDHLQMVQKRDGLWGAIDSTIMKVIDEFIREEPTANASREIARLQKELDYSESTYENFQKQAAIQYALLAKQVPQQGKWKRRNDGLFVCSQCGSGISINPTPLNYCYACGAKMDKEWDYGGSV